jgi:hypothetical protein
MNLLPGEPSCPGLPQLLRPAWKKTSNSFDRPRPDMSWAGSSCWYPSKSDLPSRTESKPKGSERVAAVLCLLFCVVTSDPTKTFTTYFPTLISWSYAEVCWRVRSGLPSTNHSDLSPTSRSDLAETKNMLVEYSCTIKPEKTRVV